jgi:hypothetical protein
MGFIGGDIQRLHTAATTLKPDAELAQAHSRAAAACGRQAAEAAARPQVSAAADSLAQVLATAITVTGTAMGQLASTSGTEGDGFEEAALA